MRKGLLYMFAAVLLGAVMMIFPQWIFWVSYATSADTLNERSYGAPEQRFGDALTVSPKEWELFGAPEEPTAGQSAAFGDVGIFLVAFILALVARFIYKRRS